MVTLLIKDNSVQEVILLSILMLHRSEIHSTEDPKDRVQTTYEKTDC